MGAWSKVETKFRAMKKVIVAIIITLSQYSWAQQTEVLVIEPFAVDSIIIDKRHLRKTLNIISKGWFKSDVTYGKLLKTAIDSTKINKCNILKVVDVNSENHIIRAELYHLDNKAYAQINRRLHHIEKQHQERYNEISWIRKITVNKYEDNWYRENRFKSWSSIPRDSTTAKYIEVGIAGGMDIILAMNLHVNTELYLLNTSFVKISLSNKAGVMLVPMGEYYITYDSPGIKFSVPIKNVWLTATFGKEYLRYHVNDENYSGIKKDVIDKRIDLGLKFYKTKEISLEFYYPLRLDDDVIPWWTGGIVISANYRL